MRKFKQFWIDVYKSFVQIIFAGLFVTPFIEKKLTPLIVAAFVFLMFLFISLAKRLNYQLEALERGDHK